MSKELDFEFAKQNTKPVSFKVDPDTSKKLTFLRTFYSTKAGRRVTTGEIIKKLIHQHFQDIGDHYREENE